MATLPTRLKKYKKYRKQGYTGYQAARLSGYAITKAEKQLTKEDMMSDMIVMNGYTPTHLAKDIIAGCKAEDTIVDKHGNTHSKANWSARQSYHKLVLELRGDIGVKALTKGDDGSKPLGLIIIRADGTKLEPQKVETIDVNINDTNTAPLRQTTPMSVNG